MRSKPSLAVAVATAAAAATAAVLPVGAVGSDGPDGVDVPMRLTDPGAPAWVSAADVRAAATAARVPKHTVVVSHLNNPRQLDRVAGGAIIIAEAGRGGKQCSGSGRRAICVGTTGSVSRIGYPGRSSHERPNRVARGFVSAAGKDGTFAVGSDGASEGPYGQVYVAMTYAPPDVLPEGLPKRQLGKLIRVGKNGEKSIQANIARFEQRNDADGEGVESNPYAALATRGRVLVADAAGDTVVQVPNGTDNVSLFAAIPDDDPMSDPVPTSLTRDDKGRFYVGLLGGEGGGERATGMVLRYSKEGRLQKSWGGFSSVTGVAVGPAGALYVSELFGGCTDDQCLPGQVVKVGRDGDREAVKVPFPSGIVVDDQSRVFVAAWSIASRDGAFGIPHSSGQVWRFRM